jgi:hypothetical protein
MDAPFIAGLIEHNLIVDTLGYNLQIKHQQPRSILSEMPEGRSATIIHNVFSKANGRSKALPRPNVRKHAGNSARFSIYPDACTDFDGGGLNGADRIGAYSLDKDRPRWLPTLEIKPINRP